MSCLNISNIFVVFGIVCSLSFVIGDKVSPTYVAKVSSTATDSSPISIKRSGTSFIQAQAQKRDSIDTYGSPSSAYSSPQASSLSSNHDNYGSPRAPATSSATGSDNYGSPRAPATGSAAGPETYGSPNAPSISGSSDSYGSPQSTPLQAAASVSQPGGQVGSQGYYYYYYPVSAAASKPAASKPAASTHYTSVATTESQSSSVSGLFSTPFVIILFVVGALVLLALLGSNNFSGRSMDDMTNMITNHVDDMTFLVSKGIEIWQNINDP